MAWGKRDMNARNLALFRRGQEGGHLILFMAVDTSNAKLQAIYIFTETK